MGPIHMHSKFAARDDLAADQGQGVRQDEAQSSMHLSASELTSLLKRWSNGDSTALDKLMPVVYDELRRQAEHHMRGENRGHTLQPTSLIHEAYLKLAQQQKVQFTCRAQFFGLASSVMRHILVDYARAKKSSKRGGGAAMVALDDTDGFVSEIESIQNSSAWSDETVDLMALDESLQRLERLDARQARIVEMRFFLSMSAEEVAAALDLSATSIKREWATARAWLLRDLGPTRSGSR